MKKTSLALILAGLFTLGACSEQSNTNANNDVVKQMPQDKTPTLLADFNQRLDIYREVTLTTDLSSFSK